MASNTRLQKRRSRHWRDSHFNSSATEPKALKSDELQHTDNAGSEYGQQLLEAAYHGQATAVKRLTDSCVSSDFCDPNSGDTPLIVASRKGQLGVVSQLLRVAVDTNKKNKGLRTALMEASEFGHTQIVRILAGQSDVNAQNLSGDSALILACNKGSQAVVDILLAKNADVTLYNCTGNTALLAACSNGSVLTVKKLLERGAVPSCANKFGCTPLMCAASSGHLQVVKLLLDKDVDVNAQNFLKNTALTLALTSRESDLSVVKILIKHGADVNIRNHMNRPLLSEVISLNTENLAAVRYLVRTCGVDVNEIDGQGRTPLIYAARSLHPGIADFLLRKGANVNQPDSEGKTAVDELFEHMLPRKGGRDYPIKREMTIKLLKFGANLTMVGCAPLVFHRSIRKGDKQFMKLMLQRGASPEPAQWYPTQASPLLTALSNESTEIVQYLISNWFFSPFDIYTLPRVLKYWKNVQEEAQMIVKNLYLQPWSLTCLCFVTVSHAVGFHRDREQKIRALQLPYILTQRLLFRDE